MADPLLDKINEATLKTLRDDIVYDNLFRESPFKILHMPLVVRRQVNYGVPYAKAMLVYEEMIKAGTIKREPEPGPESLTWDGGIEIREPFEYGTPKEIKE